MSNFKDFYKKILGKNRNYNENLEGQDVFNIAGYDPTAPDGTVFFADVRGTGTGANTVGHVYRNSDGDFFLRIRATG